MAKKQVEAAAEQQSKKEIIEALKKKMEKDFGKGTMIGANDKPQDHEAISTGSVGLDKAMGIGGYPKGRISEIYGPESSGKAQPLYCNVLTPLGWKKMKDVEIGDVTSTPNGEESTIIGIFPQGVKDIYRLTLDDKSYTDCTLDHLWLVNTRETDLYEVLSTDQLITSGLKRKNNCRKYRVPSINPINFEQYGEITINPYLLGILLGDGSFMGTTIGITSCDDEILDSINSILQLQDLTPDIHGNFFR